MKAKGHYIDEAVDKYGYARACMMNGFMSVAFSTYMDRHHFLAGHFPYKINYFILTKVCKLSYKYRKANFDAI